MRLFLPLELLSKPAQRAGRVQPRAEVGGRCPGEKAQQTKRPVGLRELCSPSSVLSSLGSRGLSGRMVVRPAYPGHRPSASALGWALPALWAGFVRCSKGRYRRGEPPLAPRGSFDSVVKEPSRTGGPQKRLRQPHSPRSERHSLLSMSHSLRLRPHSPSGATHSLRGTRGEDPLHRIPRASRFPPERERAIPRAPHRPWNGEQDAYSPCIMRILGNRWFPLGNVPRSLGNEPFPRLPQPFPPGNISRFPGKKLRRPYCKPPILLSRRPEKLADPIAGVLTARSPGINVCTSQSFVQRPLGSIEVSRREDLGIPRIEGLRRRTER